MIDTQGYLEIEGGTRLDGEISISGAKNSCLPIMAATLLTAGESLIDNVPRLRDVFTLIDVLRSLGAAVEWTGDHSLSIDTTHISSIEPSGDLVKKMRASILVMGPLFARFGQALIHLPGGCSLGKRPIDLHLVGMESLGATVQENGESVTVTQSSGSRPIGTTIRLRFPSVGATENIMMAAALADGTTVIENAAREPEISDLADILNKMGARVIGDGESSITVIGASSLKPVRHRIIPDRIEAGTYLVAGAMTAGRVSLTDVRPDHMAATLEQLRNTGCKITTESDRITIEAPDVLRPVDCRTLPYPGFSTDVQPPYMTLMTRASGECLFVEKIFDRRFLVADELKKMGADIKVLENCAVVNGGRKLIGCEVSAPDIRAAAALMVASLWANGQTCLRGLDHLYRGYENPVEKLQALGATITENRPIVKTRTEATGA